MDTSGGGDNLPKAQHFQTTASPVTALLIHVEYTFLYECAIYVLRVCILYEECISLSMTGLDIDHGGNKTLNKEIDYHTKNKT